MKMTNCSIYAKLFLTGSSLGVQLRPSKDIIIYIQRGASGTKWSDTMPESTVVVVLQISENQLVPTS